MLVNLRSALIMACLLAGHAASQPFSESLFSGMRWRNIGPFRGGRVLGVAGIPGNSQVFYMGSAGGGVWKTMDSGANWTPLWNRGSVSAIGAVAVAPSDPNVVYAGTGEALRSDISSGDGIYKSLDAGRTWRNIGLKDTRAISRIIVDPKDPELVFVAA